METIAIEKATVNRLERLLHKMEANYEIQQLKNTVSEETAAAFLGMKITSFRNRILDGTIPANAIVEMVNGKKRFRLEKLIKK